MRRVAPVAEVNALDRPRLIECNNSLPSAAMIITSMTAAQEHTMLDIFMAALGLAFFAAAIGYTYTCERL
jgi:hypothetical protein